MTIASEITRIKNNIAGAYTALSAKGATMPATQNSNNLATTVASVPAGGGDTVTATNNSSYDRVNGEKVWLSKSGDNYSIINYASADKNSLIGACKQNIAIGASGSVETLDECVLVPHLTRDFILSSGITESNIDDAAGLLTIPISTSNAFIVSNVIDMPSTAQTDFKFKIKFKYINNDPSTTPTFVTHVLGKLKNDNSADYPTSNYTPELDIKTNINSIYGTYPRSSSQYVGIEYPYTGLLNIDDWLTVSIETNSTSPYATLKIVDANGNTYTQTNTNYACSFFNQQIQRMFIGHRVGNTGNTLSAVFDLNECGLFSVDESVTYWTPYKEAEG